jgi:hypothetical protein
MPRYFFDVQNGHRLIDPSGLECRDDDEAIAQATFIARQIAADVPDSGGRQVAVLNGDRQEVGKISIPIDQRERHYGSQQGRGR